MSDLIRLDAVEKAIADLSQDFLDCGSETAGKVLDIGLDRIRAFAAAIDMQAAERARADKLLEALENIARQKKTDELDTDYGVEYADFEGGYDAIIDEARTAIREGRRGAGTCARGG